MAQSQNGSSTFPRPTTQITFHSQPNTGRPSEPPLCLHQLFEHIVARNPAAAALYWEDQDEVKCWTFEQLNEAANRIAHRLIDHGTQPEDRIGLYIERSPAMVAAQLGILKAGAAWVALDPHLPWERIKVMLEDTEPSSICTLYRHDCKWKDLPQQRLLVDQIAQREPCNNPNLAIDPQQAAYIMFTSGSTGRPKNVLGTHASMWHRLAWMWRHFPYGPAEREMQKKSINVLGSVTELYGALLAGVSAVLMPDDLARNPPLWPEFVNRHRITRFWIMPTLLGLMLEGSKQTMPSVRLCISSGEKLTPALCRHAFRRMPTMRLLNFYGQTELASDITCYEVDPKAPQGTMVGPIMSPNVAHVLDRQFNRLLPGPEGDLYLGGPFMCRGYGGNPARTADVFLPDPFSESPGARMYRSGDKVRLLSDGSLEFLGRADHLIKLRGHRIEPGEVEAAVMEHGAVAACVVAARKDRGGDHLVAYVVLHENHSLLTQQLQVFLAKSLPEYMIPTRMILLDALPLTHNGKIDRKRLPDLSGLRPDLAVAYRGPRNPREQHLSELWCACLGLDRVGIDDPFLQLGGHSLAAAKLISRIERYYAVRLSLRTFFDAGCIAALAPLLSEQGKADTGPVPGSGNPRKIPLTPAQLDLWVTQALHPHIPLLNLVCAFHVAADRDRVLAAMNHLIEQHPMLHMYLMDGPHPYLKPTASPWLTVLDMRGWSEERQTRYRQELIEKETGFVFKRDLSPRFHILLREAGTDLIWTCHHLVVDGLSLDLMVAQFHEHLREPEKPAKPATVHFADYAMWLKHRAKHAASRDWWARHLDGFAPPPLPFRRVPAGQFSARSVAFTLPTPTWTALTEQAGRMAVTPFTYCLAAWLMLLYRYSGSRDQAVMMPLAGRNHPSLERVVGHFVQPIITRFTFKTLATWNDLLMHTAEVLIEAMAHDPLPLSEIKPLLARADGHLPPMSVVVWLEGVRDEQPLPVPVRFAQSEWVLEIRNQGDVACGSLIYRHPGLSTEAAQAMANHFQNLLQHSLSHDKGPLAKLEMLDAEERSQLLKRWHAEPVSFDATPIHQRFEAMTQRLGTTPALFDEGRAISYASLNAAANHILLRLLDFGVHEGHQVPVLLPKSPSMVACWLAVLKSGAAFVPFDLDWPISRQHQVLDLIETPVVLSNRPLPGIEPTVFMPIWDEDPLESPRITLRGETPIYVMFTSGSTGKPKGVVVPHRGIANRFSWMDRYFANESPPIVLQTTPQVYDSVVWELFWPMTLGGASVLAPPTRSLDARHLAELIETHRVNVLDSVPSVFRALAPILVEDAKVRTRIASLRVVILGSEELSVETARLIERYLPEIRLINLYGPTEASIGCICYEADGQEEHNVPIGQPIDNVTALILDRDLQPVPAGVKGELFLGGPCLALGYLGDERQSRLRFVANPFPELHLDRLYRTGDLVSAGSAKQLLFHGRIDHQLKLGGVRIEPGEIESVLQQHPAVKAAAITLVTRETGGQLVALIVARELPPDLLQFINRRLPRAMVPDIFHVVAELPRTRAGKLDRKHLPNLVPTHTSHGSAPFRDALERRLAELWQQVLEHDRFSADDNFFAIGGHSLPAMIVHGHIRQIWGVALPPRTMFEAPTIRDLADSIRRASADPSIPFGALPDKRVPPLSYAQERLWFLEQWHPGSAIHNMSKAYRIESGTPPRLIARALDRVIAAHRVLTTAIQSEEGHPITSPGAAPPSPLSVLDLRHLDERTAEREARSIYTAKGNQPMDLARGPLLHTTLLLMADHHLLFLCLHHIAGDAVSLRILGSQLADALMGELPRANPLQYADFAYWQRRQLAQVPLTKRSYWRQALADTPLINLPTRRSPGAHPDYRGGSIDFTLPRATLQAATVLAERQGVGLFSVLLSAFKLWLARYCDQKDLCVGVPLAGRVHPETREMVGFFLNTLPIRSNYRPGHTFQNQLASVHEHYLAALDNELPFEFLLDELQPERDTRANPFFDVMFNYLEDEPLQRGPLRDAALSKPEQHARFQLTLYVLKRGDSLRCQWVYSSADFNHTDAERMSTHFRTLLQAALAHPNEPCNRLDMLSPMERDQLLACNKTDPEMSLEIGLHELVYRRARLTPDQVALVSDDGLVTSEIRFGRLIQASRLVARDLQRMGMRPEVPVGICLDRSPKQIVAVLAVLMAGGAFVPLDPTYPADRLQAMCEQVSARLVICSSQTSPLLAPDMRRYPLNGVPKCDGTHIEEPQKSYPASSAAYVMFTTGSSGKPKAVVGSHRAMTNRLMWWWQLFPYRDKERCIFKKSLNFIGSVPEIFSPLGQGIPLVLATDSQAANPASWPDLIERWQITRLWAIPSLIEAMIAGYRGSLPSLRICVSSGEALSASLAHEFRRRFPRVRLLDVYGSTELTSDVSLQQVTGGDVSIMGLPAHGVQLHALDRYLDLQPARVVGELFVGGAHLARGYFDDPARTALQFIPDPLGNQPGSRLYRTGDLAFRGEDGSLMLLGRADRLLKIRGYRIDPAEIEVLLETHPLAQAAKVLPRLLPGGHPVLVAYLLLHTPQDGTSLRQYLTSRLPSYMVPQHFVTLGTFPITANGKLDPEALPLPQALRDNTTTPPWLNEDERILAQIWCDLLGIENVHRDDHFFALGGHSLLVTRMLAQIEKAFKRTLAPRAVFESTSLAELARLLRPEPGKDQLPALTAHDPNGCLSQTQLRYVGMDSLELDDAFYLLWRIRHSQVPAGWLDRIFKALSKRHTILRTCFHGETCRILNVWQPDFPVIDLSGLAPETRERHAALLAGQFTHAPFDLTSPPWRVALFILGTRRFLVETYHHLISDGWSMNLLAEEQSRLLAELQQDREPILTPEAPQYHHMVSWQGRLLSQGFWQPQLDWWTTQLQKIPPHPLPAQLGPRTYRAASIVFEWDAAQASSLLQRARALCATPYMALLTVFKLALQRWTNQDDVLIGTPLAGRVPATTSIPGVFLNVVMMRTILSGCTTWEEALPLIRQTVLDAMAHGEVPFEEVWRSLGTSGSPCGVMFNFLSMRERSSESLEVQVPEGRQASIKYSMTLYAQGDERGLSFKLVYDEGQLSLEQMERFVQLFKQFSRI